MVPLAGSLVSYITKAESGKVSVCNQVIFGAALSVLSAATKPLPPQAKSYLHPSSAQSALLSPSLSCQSPQWKPTSIGTNPNFRKLKQSGSLLAVIPSPSISPPVLEQSSNLKSKELGE